MTNMNHILKELKISKVKLANILGVSRQMVYNYLQMNDINEWPTDKVEKLLIGLDLKSIDDLKKLAKSKEKLQKVKEGLHAHDEIKSLNTTTGSSSQIINELVTSLKASLLDEKMLSKDVNVIYGYLNDFINNMYEFDEFKYALEYFAKMKGLVNPRHFTFDKEEQIIFEGIVYQAMALYHNGGASKTKILESHDKMIREIEYKQEEQLSRTQELYTAKEKALQELGYKEINESNYKEFYEKLVEIENRKTN